MSPSEFKLTLEPLSDEQLERSTLPDSQVWFLREDEIMHGPFAEQELKDFMLKNSAFMTHFEACNSEDMKWKPLFDHTRLQRRSFQEKKSTEGYHVLVGPLKAGPFTEEEIQQKLKNNELLFNDLISQDGIKWMKVYHFAQFERRTDSVLPPAPSDMSFERSQNEVNDYLHSQKRLENIDKEDAMVALAFNGPEASLVPQIEQTSPVDSHVKEKNEELSADLPPPPIQELETEGGQNSKKKNIAISLASLAFVAMALLGGYIYYGQEKIGSQVLSQKEVKKTPLEKNYRENKKSLSFGQAEREPAAVNQPVRAPIQRVRRSKQQQLREEFRNARKIQNTHSASRSSAGSGDIEKEDEGRPQGLYPEDFENEEKAKKKIAGQAQTDELNYDEDKEEEFVEEVQKEEDNADEFFDEEVGDF